MLVKDLQTLSIAINSSTSLFFLVAFLVASCYMLHSLSMKLYFILPDFNPTAKVLEMRIKPWTLFSWRPLVFFKTKRNNLFCIICSRCNSYISEIELKIYLCVKWLLLFTFNVRSIFWEHPLNVSRIRNKLLLRGSFASLWESFSFFQ